MMTLDEAIKHAEEVVEEKDMQAGFDTDYLCYQMSDTERNQCKKCAEEHKQLAEWLKELKQLREQEPILSKIRAEIEQERVGYPPSAGYYKAIIKCLRIIDKYKEESEVSDGNSN